VLHAGFPQSFARQALSLKATGASQCFHQQLAVVIAAILVELMRFQAGRVVQDDANEH
jgi:hypothetical protein